MKVHEGCGGYLQEQARQLLLPVLTVRSDRVLEHAEVQLQESRGHHRFRVQSLGGDFTVAANNFVLTDVNFVIHLYPQPVQSTCLLYTSPSPRDLSTSRMPSSA